VDFGRGLPEARQRSEQFCEWRESKRPNVVARAVGLLGRRSLTRNWNARDLQNSSGYHMRKVKVSCWSAWCTEQRSPFRRGEGLGWAREGAH